MKTIIEIKSEIEQILTVHFDQRKFKKKELDTAKKRLKLLNSTLMYLETNPSTDFVLSESERLKGVIDRINNNSNFANWKQATPGAYKLKNPISAYRTEMNLKMLKDQLKTLEFIQS